MKARKKWWSIGIANYSKKVRIYFFLTLFLMIFGSNIVIKAINNLPKVDLLFIVSIFLVIALVYVFSQFVVKAKREYEINKLG